MKLSDAAGQMLDHWLAAETWHTGHDNDMDRWYRFVDQYQRDHGFTINESTLRETIEGKIGGPLNEYLRGIIREQISLAYRILDFLKCTKR